jgi:hypothetical protein
LKFSADYEQPCPQGDLDQVRQEREGDHLPGDCQIDPETCARAAHSALMAKEVYCRSQSQRVDKDRTEDSDRANRQRNQDPDWMNLRHLFRHSTLIVPKGHSLPAVANRAAERMTSPYRSQKRTSAAKAVKRQAIYGTAEAVPLVRQSLPCS